jgi:hypothetical protein
MVKDFLMCVIRLSVIRLSVIRLSVIRLNVVLLNVVAPSLTVTIVRAVLPFSLHYKTSTAVIYYVA